MTGKLLDEAKQIAPQITEYRRWLHTHAEEGFDLKETFAYVWDLLRELGYEPRKVGKCGITATVGGGEPQILLRADMDALPLKEESALPFASQNRNAHACGHDMHTAMLLGAAVLLKRHEKDLHGGVKLMFQPAEELLAGASDMISDGLLEAPVPKAALMLHVMNASGIEPGTVVIAPDGVSAPAADMFEMRLEGKACHGAMPFTGVDPINAGAHLVLALQAISTREVSLNDPHALTITAFQAGKTTNAIPDFAFLRGSVRSYDQKTQEFLKKRIGEIARLTAETFRASVQMHWLKGCPTLVNDPKLTRSASVILPALLGEKRVLRTEQMGKYQARSVGSEDFSYISHQVPSLMLAIAAGGESPLPLHHPKIVFNEKALPYGTAVYAGFALNWNGNCEQ